MQSAVQSCKRLEHTRNLVFEVDTDELLFLAAKSGIPQVYQVLETPWLIVTQQCSPVVSFVRLVLFRMLSTKFINMPPLIGNRLKATAFADREGKLLPV